MKGAQSSTRLKGSKRADPPQAAQAFGLRTRLQKRISKKAATIGSYSRLMVILISVSRATRQWSDSLKRSAMKEFIFLYSALEWVTTRTLRWRRLRTGVTVITPTLIISRKQRKYWSTSSAERCSLLRRTS